MRNTDAAVRRRPAPKNINYYSEEFRMKLTKRTIATSATTLGAMILGGVTAFAESTTGTIDAVTQPIVGLINSLLTPLLSIVGALGALFCVILGVKYAKAEEPQDREKAKAHLKNAIIGFVLIFVLMLALKLLMPALTNWVNTNGVVK